MDSVFKSAKPIWAKDAEKEINLRLQFKTIIPCVEYCIAKIATSGIYQLFVNGKFVCYGPARAGRNHFRMDEINISEFLTKEENVIVIEVVGYNVNSFEIQNQPSFLQAEITDNNNVLSFTGKGFKARKNPFYYRKTQRYSFQRPMMESYKIENIDEFLNSSKDFSGIELKETDDKKIIKRYAPYPKYEKQTAQPMSTGKIEKNFEKVEWADRSIANIGPQILGFKREELDVCPTDECLGLKFITSNKKISNEIKENEYNIYKLPFVTSGLFNLDIECTEESKVYLLFDEVLTEDKTLDFTRLDCANVSRLDLCKGKHKVNFFGVYTAQYIQIAVLTGECSVNQVGVTEYKHPEIKIPMLSNIKLQKVAVAAAETFRQNSVDILTDCPSRERAGWLCDSFFSGRAEYYATGENLVEKSFLENFLHEESYEYIPDGMLPMCYPADFYNGGFIPQWSLWGILELGEYYERSGDKELIERFKPKVYKLLDYFKKFDNSDEMLEDLEGWRFVEWSKANSLVDGVNYPTNMLYSAALKSIGELYGDEALKKKAERIKKKIIELSYNGEFFVDNAKRYNGQLISTNEISEVCQYYAFFFNIANPDTFKKLFNRLINDFGPKRAESKKWENVYTAVPFIGYFLRLEILCQNGLFEELAKNIEDYYYTMAEKTGTLWEHADLRASCCHGFSGYILCWLEKIREQLEDVT